MYLKMLEEEMRTSDQFTKENFGLQIGDGYPDLVREIVKSDNLTGRLLIGLITSSLSGRELALSMEKGMAENHLDIGSVILQNINIFNMPLSMLYWGIQIGRKLEQESARSLAELEKQGK